MSAGVFNGLIDDKVFHSSQFAVHIVTAESLGFVVELRISITVSGFHVLVDEPVVADRRVSGRLLLPLVDAEVIGPPDRLLLDVERLVQSVTAAQLLLPVVLAVVFFRFVLDGRGSRGRLGSPALFGSILSVRRENIRYFSLYFRIGLLRRFRLALMVRRSFSDGIPFV